MVSFKKIKNSWPQMDTFGKAAFAFRLSGYVFYIVFLNLYLNYLGEPLEIRHFFLILVASIAPFIFLFDYKLNNNNPKTLIKHLTFDLFLVGWYVGFLELNYLPSILFIICTISNYVASQGFKYPLRFLLLPFGYLLSIALSGIQLQMYLSDTLILLTLAYTFLHLIGTAYISYQFSRSLYKAKNEVIYQKHQIARQANQLVEINKSLKNLNQVLENKVEERTRELEIKNEKLAEYAFINGHQLRAPVATMLGLIQLLDFPLEGEDKTDILDKLRYEVNLLDITIKDIRLRLETDQLVNKELHEVEFNLARSKNFLDRIQKSDDG